MKKTIITLVVGLLISVASIAQSKAEVQAETIAKKDIQKISAVVSMNEEEQEKYITIKKEYLINHFKIVKEYRKNDPEKFKEKRTENGKKLNADMVAAFGKPRALEFLKAARAK